MKKLLQNIYKYSCASAAGGTILPLALYALRKDKDQQLKFLLDFGSLLASTFDPMQVPTAGRMTNQIEQVRAWLTQGVAVTGNSQRIMAVPGEGRDRLMEYLKRDEPVCLCPRCIVATMTGMGHDESESHAPN